MRLDSQILQLLERWEELCERGAAPTPEELCQDCPDRLEEVRRAIRDLKGLESLLDGRSAEALAPPALAHPNGEPPPPAAAFTGLRFQPLRFHARGGQGEVFLARDEELEREVALKRIPPHRGRRDDSVRRFVREARITGRLEHPGVVPVYGLGRDADGQPYYAMRFVQGESLADAIQKFHAGSGPDAGARVVAFRHLLSRFVALCNVVAYAHSRGVIHRDLKPQNVMLGAYGETLVVDWGLAKVVNGATPDAPPPTGDLPVTGEQLTPGPEHHTPSSDFLGTPAYTSPEQAARLWDHVGPASDVYSLGATLYVLLTGRVPFDARDVGQLLEDVQRGAFPRPRQVTPGVPPALEAVCLKAMALKPGDRYASALALASDVEHWLADEPVSAYREPFTVQVRRWCRRRRSLVVGAATLVFMVLVLLVVTNVQSARARQALADEQRQTKVERDTAQAEQKRAVTARNRTRAALDAMTSIVTGEALTAQKELSEEQREFLASALIYYQEFAAEPGEGREELERLAGAHSRLGMIYYRLGRAKDGADLLQRGGELSQRLAADFPDVPRYRSALAATHNNLGLLLDDLGRREAAETAYRAALAVREKLAADFPDVPAHRQSLARSYGNLGNLLTSLDRSAEAEAAYRAALAVQQKLASDYPAVPAHRRELAASHHNLGLLLGGLGKSAEAEAAHRAALALYERLAADFPAVPEYRPGLARSHHALGELLRGLGKSAEAEAAHRAALALRARLAADFPAVPGHRRELAASHHALGELLRGLGKSAEAEAAYRAALALTEELAADFPAVPDYRQALAVSRNNLGALLMGLGKSAEAGVVFRDAQAVQQKLAADYPTVPAHRLELATSHHNRGTLLKGLGKSAEAEAAYRAALALTEELAADFPAVSKYRQELASNHSILGSLLIDLGKNAEAEAPHRATLALRAKLAADFPTVPEYRAELAQSHHNLGGLLRATNRPRGAEAAYRDAIALRAKLAADFPTVPGYRAELARTHNSLGLLLSDAGRLQEAEAAYRAALALRDKLAADFPTVSSHANSLAGTLVNLALLARDRKDHVQARQLLEQALPHHRAALRANPRNPDYRRFFRNNTSALAPILVALGDHTAATAKAEELAGLDISPATDTYNAARCLALCVPLAANDPTLEENKRRELAESYGRRGVRLLRHAVVKGYTNVAHMQKDSDLDSLRRRADFAALLWDLADAPAARQAKP